MQRNPLLAYTPKTFSKRAFNAPHRGASFLRGGNWGKKIFRAIMGLCCIGIVGLLIYLQIRVFKDLPDVSQIKNLTLSQATIITDKNGQELYKIFDENRQFVALEEVNQYMIDAIVAVEDQRFWQNEGLDPMGIFRAGLRAMLGQNWGGGSTITQQLITNVMNLKRPFGGSLLDKIDYKLKQIVLAKRLNNVLQKQIKAEDKNLAAAEVKHEMKKKLLELYLNYVFLGNNAYGVEAASKTYFSKPAKNLTALEAAILASIPKAPSRYDPYKSAVLMGSFTITDGNGVAQPFEWNLKASILSKYRENIVQASFANKKAADTFVRFVASLCPSNVVLDGKAYKVAYVNGRAEFSLGRLFEDGKITEDELKSAFLESLSKEFIKSSFEIKAPHFVFWVKDLLEKDFWTGVTKEGGLVVKTTLDYEIQKLAENALTNNKAAFFENGATNGSMLYIDSQNWDVLAYVGSLDYFNKEIQGQNDMVRNPRQSGSSIKPLIYALGFEKLPLTLDTPIYDILFKAGKDTPNNADGKFDGLLPLKKALGFSRNIPAVKMFFALGGEGVAKPYLQRLGLSWIKNEIEYGYPLALGAGEVSMLELAEAYSHLSTATPARINPILEIRTSNWELLYSKEVEKKENLIKPGIITLMWKILSDPSNRLGVWTTKFNVKGLTYALKTGTSNVKTDRGSRPRDGWLAAYTPSRVVLMWAGNANATPMNRNAYGGTIHANSIKSFLGELLQKNYLNNEEMPNKDTTALAISRVSGKLPSEYTPIPLIVQTLGWNGRLPQEVEGPISEIELDSSCYGKASPLTPEDQVKKGYLIQPSSFMPNKMDLEDIKNYLKERAITGDVQGNLNLFSEEPQHFCENRQPSENDQIKITFVRPQGNIHFAKKNNIVYAIASPTPIKKVSILLDGNTVASFIDNSTEIFASKALDLSNYSDGSHTLSLVVVDQNNMTKTSTLSLTLVSEDKGLPVLKKDQSKVILLPDGKYDVSLIFDDEISGVKGGKIFQKWGTQPFNTFQLQATSFVVSKPEINFEVEDFYGNVLKGDLNLSNF